MQDAKHVVEKGDILKKSAFTMMELIIVLVVAGILAAVMIPRLERDTMREAANQVVRHIQYAQHLALVDDVYNAANPDWENAYWHISFRTNTKKCYIVGSDRDTAGAVAQTESAMDPLTKQYLYSDTSCTENSENNNDLFLNTKYGISTVTLSNSCGTNQMIAFDNYGRPLKTRSSADPITTQCTITLSDGTQSAVITIEPETGYTRITSLN